MLTIFFEGKINANYLKYTFHKSFSLFYINKIKIKMLTIVLNIVWKWVIINYFIKLFFIYNMRNVNKKLKEEWTKQLSVQ